MQPGFANFKHKKLFCMGRHFWNPDQLCELLFLFEYI